MDLRIFDFANNTALRTRNVDIIDPLQVSPNKRHPRILSPNIVDLWRHRHR